jgi:hypothetical protein
MGCTSSYTYESDDDSIIDELSNIYLYRRSKIYLFICYSNDDIIDMKNIIDEYTDFKIIFILNNKNINNKNIIYKFNEILKLINNNDIYEVWISIFNNNNIFKVSDYPIFNDMFQSFLTNLPLNINVFCLFDIFNYNINFNFNFIYNNNFIQNNHIIKEFKSTIIIIYGHNHINKTFLNIYFNNKNEDILSIFNKLYYFSKIKYDYNIILSFNKKRFIYKILF